MCSLLSVNKKTTPKAQANRDRDTQETPNRRVVT